MQKSKNYSGSVQFLSLMEENLCWFMKKIKDFTRVKKTTTEREKNNYKKNQKNVSLHCKSCWTNFQRLLQKTQTRDCASQSCMFYQFRPREVRDNKITISQHQGGGGTLLFCTLIIS